MSGESELLNMGFRIDAEHLDRVRLYAAATERSVQSALRVLITAGLAAEAFAAEQRAAALPGLAQPPTWAGVQPATSPRESQ